jgi:hypothetical protein
MGFRGGERGGGAGEGRHNEKRVNHGGRIPGSGILIVIFDFLLRFLVLDSIIVWTKGRAYFLIGTPDTPQRPHWAICNK